MEAAGPGAGPGEDGVTPGAGEDDVEVGAGVAQVHAGVGAGEGDVGAGAGVGVEEGQDTQNTFCLAAPCSPANVQKSL